MKNSLITYNNYGTIKCNLKKLMKERNITRTQLVKQTNLHHQIIDRYIKGTLTRYDRDVLAKLCFVLECKLSDLLYYENK